MLSPPQLTLVCTDVKAIPPVKGAPLEGGLDVAKALRMGPSWQEEGDTLTFSWSPMQRQSVNTTLWAHPPAFPYLVGYLFGALPFVVQHQLGAHSFLLPLSAFSP